MGPPSGVIASEALPPARLATTSSSEANEMSLNWMVVRPSVFAACQLDFAASDRAGWEDHQRKPESVIGNSRSTSRCRWSGRRSGSIRRSFQ
jgi:hypothetical protein